MIADIHFSLESVGVGVNIPLGVILIGSVIAILFLALVAYAILHKPKR